MICILYKNKKLIPPISEEASKLLNYFSIKKSNIFEEKKQIKDNDNFELNKLNIQLINELESFAKSIKDKMKDKKFKNLIEGIANFIDFLKIYNVIFIPFLGPSNAGKSTIINGIIGKKILPTNLNECTKRGIIIRHINSDDIFLYKADFKEDKDILGHRNYYFEQQNIIAKGEEDVINTLNGLNYAFNDKIEDSFYYIRTRIKLFDDMQIADSLKQKIFLIDFPGFGTGNIFEKKNIYNKVLSICHLFVFVVRNSVIKENSFKSKLKDIFDKAQIEKKN
jgi:hypothetical protein